jgi:hypothetical protein
VIGNKGLETTHRSCRSVRGHPSKPYDKPIQSQRVDFGGRQHLCGAHYLACIPITFGATPIALASFNMNKGRIALR